MTTPAETVAPLQTPSGLSGLVPVKEADHLEQDAPIRGQRFACVSFVSPEEAIACKEAFCVRRFMAAVAQDLGATLDSVEAAFGGAARPAVTESVRMLRERHAHLWDDAAMQAEYKLYCAQAASELDEGFRAAHGGFKTSVRGFKIRGAYDTVEEARDRAKALRRTDDRFHVFVTEVGCWCPWSPNVEELKDSEYSETQLNTLVKKYKESMDAQEEIYHERKKGMVDQMSSDRDAWLERMREATRASGAEGGADAAAAAAAPANAGVEGPPEGIGRIEEGAEGEEGAPEVIAEAAEGTPEGTAAAAEVTPEGTADAAEVTPEGTI